MVSHVDLDAAPATVPDAYLRLHLLSHRFVQPHAPQSRRHLRGASQRGVDLRGALRGADLRRRARFRAFGKHLTVYGVDKFPRMVDYVVPSGVRIADADRVRLGAHLAEGTTVMHEGFVNFNAGTLAEHDRGPRLVG